MKRWSALIAVWSPPRGRSSDLVVVASNGRIHSSMGLCSLFLDLKYLRNVNWIEGGSFFASISCENCEMERVYVAPTDSGCWQADIELVVTKLNDVVFGRASISERTVVVRCFASVNWGRSLQDEKSCLAHLLNQCLLITLSSRMCLARGFPEMFWQCMMLAGLIDAM